MDDVTLARNEGEHIAQKEKEHNPTHAQQQEIGVPSSSKSSTPRRSQKQSRRSQSRKRSRSWSWSQRRTRNWSWSRSRSRSKTTKWRLPRSASGTQRRREQVRVAGRLQNSSSHHTSRQWSSTYRHKPHILLWEAAAIGESQSRRSDTSRITATVALDSNNYHLI
jgi:hypothetical protein